MTKIDPSLNPWRATTKSELRLRQIGCALVFLYVIVSIVGLVLFVGVSEYGWFS